MFLHEKFCGHTEFLPRRSSEIPMENFTCKRLLSALKGGRSGLRATSTLRALCVRVQSKRHAHTCNTATRLHDSNKTRRCGHSAVEYQSIAQGMHTPATPQHNSTLRALCVLVQFDDVCSSGYVKTRTRRDMCERWRET